jgi:hypothetical protein
MATESITVTLLASVILKVRMTKMFAIIVAITIATAIAIAIAIYLSLYLYYSLYLHCCTTILADGGTGIVEMLFCTSLVALVGAGEQPTFSTRHLQIINTKVTYGKEKVTLSGLLTAL